MHFVALGRIKANYTKRLFCTSWLNDTIMGARSKRMFARVVSFKVADHKKRAYSPFVMCISSSYSLASLL